MSLDLGAAPPKAALFAHDLSLSDIAIGLLDLLVSDVRDRRLGDALTDLGDMLAPQELAEVYQLVAIMVTEDTRLRIARLAPQWNQFTSRGGYEFGREVLFDGAVLYRSATVADARPAMVCFTSRRNGLFMANCRFLDLLGAYPVDVIILTSDDGTFGNWNLGAAGGFYAALQLLKSTLGHRGIRPGVYVGASAGGGPAVHAALLDGQASANMIGGRFYSPGRKIPLSQAGTAFAPLCNCWQGPGPPVYSIFGADMLIDVENNARLVAQYPAAQVHPIPKDDKHNPMATLASRQKLRDVIDLIVRVASGKAANFDLVTTL